MVASARLAFRRVIGLVIRVFGGRLVGAVRAMGMLGSGAMFADHGAIRVLFGLVAPAGGGGANLRDAVARHNSVHVVLGQLLNVQVIYEVIVLGSR
jgi:hypothetical protein